MINLNIINIYKFHHCPSLLATPGFEHTTFRSQSGVLFTPDLALDKQTSAVSAKCFYQLRQLRRVRRSLDADSAKILVHALVTSRIDYCNALLANAPSIWTDKLQRVVNAAARVITDTRKFDRGLTSILNDDLHWLDLPRRVLFKISVMVYISLHSMAPKGVSIATQLN